MANGLDLIGELENPNPEIDFGALADGEAVCVNPHPVCASQAFANDSQVSESACKLVSLARPV